MAYLLAAQTIRRPNEFVEERGTLFAEHRTLDGSITRDYFGDEKRVWALDYQNVNATDYDTIKTIYSNYLSSAEPVSFEVTESNYTVNSTTVHVDLNERGFSVKGSNYLSDFTLILKEA